MLIEINGWLWDVVFTGIIPNDVTSVTKLSKYKGPTFNGFTGWLGPARRVIDTQT